MNLNHPYLPTSLGTLVYPAISITKEHIVIFNFGCWKILGINNWPVALFFFKLDEMGFQIPGKNVWREHESLSPSPFAWRLKQGPRLKNVHFSQWTILSLFLSPCLFDTHTLTSLSLSLSLWQRHTCSHTTFSHFQFPFLLFGSVSAAAVAAGSAPD